MVVLGYCVDKSVSPLMGTKLESLVAKIGVASNFIHCKSISFSFSDNCSGFSKYSSAIDFIQMYLTSWPVSPPLPSD